MKLLKRAEQALTQAGVDPATNPAIALLVNFAAQNSGIDYRNYYQPGYDRDGSGRRSFQSESRSIAKDWREVKSALVEAIAEGVTDKEVLSEAPRAFSGRLEWFDDAWHYCTGQYFPTEYRKATRTVLEAATNLVRRTRPPQTRASIKTIAELKSISKANGNHFFDADAMRFFNSRIEGGIIADRYFITSEKQDDTHARNYTIREFNETGGMVSHYDDPRFEFQAHKTKLAATVAIRDIVNNPPSKEA